MASTDKTLRLLIAALIGACFSLGGSWESLAYRDKPQRLPVSRVIRPESVTGVNFAQDALPSVTRVKQRDHTSIHARRLVDAILSAGNALPVPFTQNQFHLFYRKIPPAIVSINPPHDRAPPSV